MNFNPSNSRIYKLFHSRLFQCFQHTSITSNPHFSTSKPIQTFSIIKMLYQRNYIIRNVLDVLFDFLLYTYTLVDPER